MTEGIFSSVQELQSLPGNLTQPLRQEPEWSRASLTPIGREVPGGSLPYSPFVRLPRKDTAGGGKCGTEEEVQLG